MKSFFQWLENLNQSEFGNENVQNKKEIVVLVGPPAIGKSSYIKNKFHPKEAIVVSRDDIVDEVSSSMGLTYDDMFVNPPQNATIGQPLQGKEKYGIISQAPPWMVWTKTVYSNIQKANDIINKKLQEKFKNAVESGKNIIVDTTNMTAGARKNALKYVKDKDYFKRAVVFTLQDSDLPELINRMKNRSEIIKSQGGSKSIGEDVVYKMIKNFQQISPEEGFDKVESINTFT